MAQLLPSIFNEAARRLAAGAGIAILFCAPSLAAGEGAVVLTIDGKTAGGKSFELTMADLEQMTTAVLRTSTPWHDHVVEFEGVRLSDLMAMVGAEGENAFVVALNDYTADIPVSDFESFDPILALREDGELMPVGDKGPAFIVYPYDENKDLQSEKYYLRSVWSVSSITIE